MWKKTETLKYVFTVEGDTERWYLEWLANQIRSCGEINVNVSIQVTIEQSPFKYIKGITRLTTPEIYHICDVESNEKEHEDKFNRILKEMKNAEKEKGVTYKLGYSNYTFELWMILHKEDCSGSLTNRRQYLKHIRSAFGENFKSLDKYKEFGSFHRCLDKLTLNDVKNAIERSKRIIKQKEDSGILERQCYGYKYYYDNPALSIWEAIETIFKDCGYLP